MKKTKTIIFTILLIIWMVTVWSFSNQNADTSSGVSGGFLYRLFNITMDNENIDTYQFLIRKTAHFSIYFIGGFISYMLLESIDYKKNKYLAVVAFIFLFASTDEFHQTFVNGRSGQVSDVMLDTSGAILFLLITYLYNKFKAKNKLDK